MFPRRSRAQTYAVPTVRQERGFEEYGLRCWDSKERGERGSLPIYRSQYMPMGDQKDLLTVSAVLGNSRSAELSASKENLIIVLRFACGWN